MKKLNGVQQDSSAGEAPKPHDLDLIPGSNLAEGKH